MGSGFLCGRPARLVVAVAALGLAAMVGALTSAQEERREVRMTVEGGIDGWVDPRWPMTLTANITSDILLVGELLVVQGQELARQAVEVPAGGVRSYQVVVAPPSDQGAVLLRLIPHGASDDQPVASALFRPKTASEEILVGLVDVPGLEEVLGDVRSAVTGEPITPIQIEDSSQWLESGKLQPLSYLVLNSPGPLPPATVDWLRGGGRLITTSSSLNAMELNLISWGSFPSADAPIDWYGLGEGEIVAMEALGGHHPAEWASLLRPLPLPTNRPAGFWEGGIPLTQAALASESETPSYPWLPVVVVAYALMVGPLNLWILRKKRRLEWAWVTIPLAGVAGVVVFWMVGAGGIDQVFWSHGTVQVAGTAGESRSAVVAASSRARNLEISFDPGWDLFPENPDRISGGSVQPVINGAGAYEYELPALGWLAVNAFGRGKPTELTVEFDEQGMELTNHSSAPVLWGVHSHPKVAFGGAVDPDTTGLMSWTSVLDSGSWWGFQDSLWEFSNQGEAIQMSPNWPQVVGGLGNLAQTFAMVDVPFFVFAVVHDPITFVEVQGQTPVIPGIKLVLFPIPLDQMGDQGWAYGRPVWVEDAFGDVGFDGDPVSSEQWILSYRLPAQLSVAPRLMLGGLDSDFGRPPGRFDEGEESDEGQAWEAWDWEASEFVAFDIDHSIDSERFIAASGELLLKVSDTGLPMPAHLVVVLTWGDWS